MAKNYQDITEKQGLQPTEKESIWDKFKKQLHERKSEKMIFGMPVYHIGRNAHGFFAIGFKARGVFSFGLISRGIFSVGYFSTGALVIGKYVAVGDHAHAMIAIGQTVADGSVYSHIGDLTTADIPKVVEWLDGNVPSWLGWAKEIFKFYIQ